MPLDLTATNPDLKDIDLAKLEVTGAFPDGSGGGILQFAYALQRVRETEERCALLRAFILKHQDILAGLSWRADDTCLPPVKREDILFVPQIELNGYTHARKNCSPLDVAALWPEAEWSRSMPKYCSLEETCRDYTAEVDGVTLRITDAERKKPVKVDQFPRCGRLGKIVQP